MHHYSKTFSLFVITSLLLIIYTIIGCSPQNSHTSQLKEKLDPEMWNALSAPNLVTVFTTQAKINGSYTINSKERELSKEEILNLQQLLLDDKGYIFGMHKRCVFIPDMGFNFENKKIVVLVSPTCHQVKFLYSEKELILDYDPQKKGLGALSRVLSTNISSN